MKTRTYVAHEICDSANLYNTPISFTKGGTSYECLGYSRSGKTIIFGRLEPTELGIRQINRYVLPDTPVYIN